MEEVKFVYKGNIILIQCNINDKMEDIIYKFLFEINKFGEPNSLNFLYNNDKVKNELTLIEQIDELDKKINKIYITVTDKDKIISKDIICPKCKENILLEIKNYKINLYGCKNNHRINDIPLNKYEKTQKINLKKIICCICFKNDKTIVKNNSFFRCNTCNKNICPTCISIHNKNHKIINYDDKNYVCKEHCKLFSYFCKTCNKDIWKVCEKGHFNHNYLKLSEIIVDKDDFIKIKDYLANAIEKFRNKNIINKEKFNKCLNLLDLYYTINDNTIINYDKINHIKLQNLNYLKYNNIKLIKELNDIIRNDELLELFEFVFHYFNYNKGSKYFGEMKNNLKHGKGTMYYNGGGMYIGDWKNDLREGKGITYFKEGNVYKGDFKNNIEEGEGIYYYISGDRYEGSFKNNLAEGKGIYYFNNGERYEGDFKNNIREGKGKMLYNNGNTYDGDWKNDLREGKGIIYFSDGRIFHGYFQNDKPNGEGKICHPNGDIYEDIYKNGIPEERGIMYYINGDKYKGFWKNSRREGKGILYYNDGDIYNGEWKNNIIEGKGIYYYNDGDIYNGDWKNDIREGKGIIYLYNGNKYEGDFKNDCPEGKGIYYWINGDKYEGDFKNGVREGKGIYYYRDGRAETGYYINDEYIENL